MTDQDTLPGLEDLAAPETVGDLPPGAPPSRVVAQVRAVVARTNRKHSTVAGHAVSADQRRTMEREALVDAGWHPLTKLPLLVGTGETCGDCDHHVISPGNTRTYHKCDLAGVTRGPGTDLRVSWPACQRYQRPCCLEDPEFGIVTCTENPDHCEHPAMYAGRCDICGHQEDHDGDR